MTSVSDTVIRQMVEAIVDVSDPEQVILFGSRSRGDFTERPVVPHISSRSVGGATAPVSSSGVGSSGSRRPDLRDR